MKFKRLGALMLMLAMLLSLSPASLAAEPADASAEVPESGTPVEGSSDVPADGPADVPADGPADGPAEEPADGPAAVKTIFALTPEELTLEVYALKEEVKTVIEPEEDGSFMLLPGRYFYSASCEGCESILDKEFTVEASEEPLKIEINLKKLTAGDEDAAAEGAGDAAAPDEAVPGGIAIDEAHFPDAIFRTYVSSEFDTDSDGFLSTEETGAVDSINLEADSSGNCMGKPDSERIRSLKGIEYFTELDSLNCNHNMLTSLDLSANTKLTGLLCSDNLLSSLDLSGITGLTYVECAGNRLTDLNLGDNTGLFDLRCSGNLLSTLDVSGFPEIKQINCQQNRLTEIDVSHNPALWMLSCSNNRIKDLDLSANTELGWLLCGYNALENLDLSLNKALSSLDCPGNFLTHLDLSANTELGSLQAEGNRHEIPAGGIDTKDLPGFDAGKVKSCTGGSFKDGVFSFESGSDEAVYTYDVGQDKTADFCFFCREDTADVEISGETFPDSNFRAYVKENIDTDANGFLSYDELHAVTVLNLNGMGKTDAGKIKDLKGIEYFDRLSKLDCSKNKLSELNLSQNTSLEDLDCRESNVVHLDISGCPFLEGLHCDDNHLNSLELSHNPGLSYFDCSGNNFRNLDVSACTGLNELNCSGNLLRSLDVSHNEKLQSVDCSSNELESINFGANSKVVSARLSGNRLRSLDLSKLSELSFIDCSNNCLTSLDLSGNTRLYDAKTDGNRITIPAGGIDTKDLPGFDAGKVISCRGGEFLDNGMFRFNEGTEHAEYVYDVGRDRTATFAFDKDRLNDEPGGLAVTSFEELKEVVDSHAANKNITVSAPDGKKILISEDINIVSERNFSLFFQSPVEIAKGVCFHFEGKNIRFSSDLTVSGTMECSGNLVVVLGACRGLENITALPTGYLKRTAEQSAEDEAGIKRLLSEASDPQYDGFNNNIYAHTPEGVIHISSADGITVPENVCITFRGDTEVDAGSKLQLEGKIGINSRLTVNGAIAFGRKSMVSFLPGTVLDVSNAQKSGRLRARISGIDSEAEARECIVGYAEGDLEFKYNDFEKVFDVRDISGMEKLPAPSNPRWGIEYYTDENGETHELQRSDVISFDTNNRAGNVEYVITLYRKAADGGEDVFSRCTSRFNRDGADVLSSFPMADERFEIENGDYYAVITARVQDESALESDPVKSPVWHYEKSTDNLPEIQNIRVVPGTGRYSGMHIVEFDRLEDESLVYGYGCEIKTTDNRGWILTTADVPAEFFHKTVFKDSFLDSMGYENLNVTVWAISRDKNVISDSIHTDHIMDIADPNAEAKTEIENIAANLDGKTPDQVREDVRSVEDISAVMESTSNEKVRENIEKIEESTGTGVEIDVAPGLGISRDGASVLGAALNEPADPDKPMTLKVTEPQEDVELPAKYDDKNVLSLAITVENMKNTENLQVPVAVELTLSADINPGELVILHYKKGSELPEEVPFRCDFMGRKVIFVLDGFSEFRFTCRKNSAPANGDVDGSGRIDIMDITPVMKYLTGELQPEDKSLMDVNTDGRIDIMDVIALMWKISD